MVSSLENSTSTGKVTSTPLSGRSRRRLRNRSSKVRQPLASAWVASWVRKRPAVSINTPFSAKYQSQSRVPLVSRVSLRSILLSGKSSPEKSSKLVLPLPLGPISTYQGSSSRQRSLRPRYTLEVLSVRNASLKRARSSLWLALISASRRSRSWPTSLSSASFLRTPARQLTKTMVRPQIRHSALMVNSRAVASAQNLCSLTANSGPTHHTSRAIDSSSNSVHTQVWHTKAPTFFNTFFMTYP